MNNIPVNQSNSEHYVWGKVCDGWHLLKTPNLSIIQERVPAGSGEQMHFHSAAQQFFYILSGSAALEFEAETVVISAGEGLYVPPNSRHCFKNLSQDEVNFLVISNPTTAGDRTNV
jgi:mannose-6-phosphate isomerase-like protein (cupin superfamily)